MKAQKPQGGSNFEPTPDGVHLGICIRQIDLGTQLIQSRMYGPSEKHQIAIGWELPDVRIEYEIDGVKHEGPAIHYEKYRFSFHENSLFRPMLVSWRGKEFTDEDFEPGPNQWDTRSVLGVPATLQVMRRKGDDGKTYADLKTIMRVPGMKRENWPKPENEILYYSIEDHDSSVFDKLSKGWQSYIMKSKEWQERFGHTDKVQDPRNDPRNDQRQGAYDSRQPQGDPGPSPNQRHDNDYSGNAGFEPGRTYDDEIPF